MVGLARWSRNHPRINEKLSGGVGMVRGELRGKSNRRQRGELWTLTSLKTHCGKSSPMGSRS